MASRGFSVAERSFPWGTSPLGRRPAVHRLSDCGVWAQELRLRALKCRLSGCGVWAQELRLRALQRRLSGCGVWAQLSCSMWNLPGLGVEPVPLHWQEDSYPLYHQESPELYFLNICFSKS